MKKRWSGALLAGALALTLLTSPAQAIRMNDSHGVQTVESGSWYEAEQFPTALSPTAILYSYGLVNGTGALNSDDWQIPLEYYSCTALSGEGREGSYMLQAMDELTALYNQLVDEDMTDYQKVKAIYEGVMARTDYNNAIFNKYKDGSDRETMYNDPEFILSQAWLGVVKGADVVCGGYSQAVSSLLDLAGIPNFVVTSYSGNMGHAWNKVLLDGKWYNLDATWGDGGNASRYFLRSDQVFLRDGHEDYGWDGTSEDALLFPALQDYR